jgi:hypothetical protein
MLLSREAKKTIVFQILTHNCSSSVQISNDKCEMIDVK